MIFLPTTLPGVFRFDVERLPDHRGFFARTWCAREAAAHGLSPMTAQCSVSFNLLRGTLRGMHFQAPPHAEAKVVRCTRGAVHDVVLDLRRDSATFLQWEAFELTQENRSMVYIPEGCAHGFQTLVDETEVLYQMSEFYDPASARGVRWNDPAAGIAWPLPSPILSERDAAFPLLER